MNFGAAYDEKGAEHHFQLHCTLKGFISNNFKYIALFTTNCETGVAGEVERKILLFTIKLLAITIELESEMAE